MLRVGVPDATSPEEPEVADLGVVLVGNANVGKSALFGALTGTYATVSNYPGTTVELTRGVLEVGGGKWPLVDTPGTASFLPSSEDERVVRDMLLSGRPRATVVVGDAKNLTRALALCVELAEMETPFVLCLNMADEARARGIRFDTKRLEDRLGVAVTLTTAIQREGLRTLAASLQAPRRSPVRVQYPEAFERALAEATPLMPPSPLSPRSLAVMLLCGDKTLAAWLGGRLNAGARERLEALRQRVRRECNDRVLQVVNDARLRLAATLAKEAVVRAPQVGGPPGPVAARLDALTTHRVFGFAILGAVLAAMYWLVGVFGAGTLVGLLEDRLFGGIINPAATAVVNAVIPWVFVRDLLVGPYGVVTMALTYSLALVLPIVTTFFLAFGVLEDSGYLPRLAVMANRVFKKLGLNGKAVLPMVLGLGCDTMATLTTRILETPKERLIVILLLALGVPCSAQLTVVFALTAGLSPWAFLVWALVVLSVLFAVGRLAAAVLPGRGSDFVLELPPMRMPRLENIAVKTLARLEWYLKEAVPLFVVGTLLLFVADRLHVLGSLERAAQPFLAAGLGLPPQTAEAFIVGFLRRDFGAAGLYGLAQRGQLDAIQIVVAAVTLTLFIPCIANFLMIVKERGVRTACFIAVLVVALALGVGALLNLALRALPWILQ